MTLATRKVRSFQWLSMIAALALLRVTAAQAGQASTEAQKEPAEPSESAITLTATSANVTNAGDTVKINIIGWSSDAQRNQLVVAMTAPAPAPASGGDGARNDRGAAGARNTVTADAAAAAGRGGRGAAAPARGAGSVPNAAVDPVAAAIAGAPTVGYLWTSDIAGYSIKYAYRSVMADGSQRIILATDRRLGAANSSDWKPVAPSTSTDYKYTIIEFRLDAKGLGEGKASVNTKVTVDGAAKTIALDSYAAAPAILKNVKLIKNAKR